MSQSSPLDYGFGGKKRGPLKNGRIPSFTAKHKEVTRSILLQYNALKLEKHGGVRLNVQNNAAAYEAWKTATGRQIERAAWRKLCSRVRGEEAEKMVSEPDVDGDPLHNVKAIVDEDTESCELKHNVTHGNEDTVTENVSIKARKLDHQHLSDTLEDLHLQLITIGDWILVQRGTFDIHVMEEPYHSVQIYANMKSMKFIRRVWGMSERSGELKTVDDLRDLCIATFNKSVVCLGHICPDPDRDIDLVQVKYPFTRWISDSCCIRYSKDQCGEIIGICSACSGGAVNIKKIGIKNEMEEPYEFLTEEDKKYESEDVPLDMKSDKGDGDILLDNYEPDSDTNMEEDYNDVADGDNENVVDPVFDVYTRVNDSANFKEVNAAYWENIRNEPTDFQEIQNEDHGIGRNTNYTKKEMRVVKYLLNKYNSLKQEACGGKRLSQPNNVAALETFKAYTERQINRDSWRKLCSRLRCEEASKSDAQFSNDDLEAEEVLAIEGLLKAKHEEMSMKEDIEVYELKIEEHGIGRNTNYTKKEIRVVRYLLNKYNSLRPEACGGKRLSQKNNLTAFLTFKAYTACQTHKEAWTKLCSRLRSAEGERLATKSDALFSNDDLDAEERSAIETKHEEISKAMDAPENQNQDHEIGRITSYTKKEIRVAKALLAKYNSLKPETYGGQRMSKWDNIAALDIFNSCKRTTHQTHRDAWRKLCSRLRCEEGKRLASKTNDQVVNYDLDEALLAIAKKQQDISKNPIDNNKGSSSSSTVQKSLPVQFFCAECPKTFPLRSILQKHIGRDHKKHKVTGDEYELQTCDKCGLSFSGISSLNHHMKTKHSSYAEREYKCTFPGCNKAFVAASNLNMHKPAHGERKFVCDHCGTSYWQKGQLTHHLRFKHKALPELELKCKHCEEIFPGYNERMWHTNLIHFPERYKCSICQKTFASDYLLTRHTKSAHEDRTFIQCQECGKQIATEFGLRVHMRLHNGELISCSYCPWKSHIRSKLYKHMRLQHKEEWDREQEKNKDSFNCPECGKAVVNKSALTLHRIRVHGQKHTTCVA